MIWGEESDGRGDLFQVETLPEAGYRDEEHSLMFGLGATAPKEDAFGEAAGSSEFGATSGDSAWKRRLAPRHRDAVRTFFTPDKED